MNQYLKLICNALITTSGALVLLTSGAALAQRDCSKASDASKAQCEARNKAEAKCGKLEGDARRICQRDEMPRDCAKADNKPRCETEVAAHKSCRGDAKTYRSCMDTNMGRDKK